MMTVDLISHNQTPSLFAARCSVFSEGFAGGTAWPEWSALLNAPAELGRRRLLELPTARRSIFISMSEGTGKTGALMRNLKLDEMLNQPGERVLILVTDAEMGSQSTAPWQAVLSGQPTTTLAAFTQVVSSWRHSLSEHHFIGLNKRLEFLFEDDLEIGQGQEAPSTTSFSAMLAYLATKPEFKTPSIGYNRDGSFSAVWVGDQKLRVTLNFVDPSHVRWVYVDSRNGIETAVTGAGTVTHQILHGILKSYGALNWMQRT